MKNELRGNQEAAAIEQALTTMKSLLHDYRAVADGACYHYAKAEVLRLEGEASAARAREDLRELTDRAWRQARALEQAIAEWSGDEFYALGGGGYGNARLPQR